MTSSSRMKNQVAAPLAGEEGVEDGAMGREDQELQSEPAGCNRRRHGVRLADVAVVDADQDEVRELDDVVRGGASEDGIAHGGAEVKGRVVERLAGAGGVAVAQGASEGSRPSRSLQGTGCGRLVEGVDPRGRCRRRNDVVVSPIRESHLGHRSGD
jgi:hypothetical protein